MAVADRLKMSANGQSEEFENWKHDMRAKVMVVAPLPSLWVQVPLLFATVLVLVFLRLKSTNTKLR